ncbi:hypothetical protein MF672_008620 [Actinomadura sp. ATCC 31491]|uniref:Secreted protein n=1 Tax=Actinomadura luzonensis TaxID=2805427 RepID=A0ABT0FND0_9ACTN|nr:hypothetical protein [Actinomadura luzonensis]MCK2213852.1 hypothetical protein [Actinomadura luzonensis]
MRIIRIVLLAALVPALGASVAPVPAQAATARSVLVEYRRQGGFAGFDDRVVAYGNGCVRLSRRTGPVVNACLTGKEERGLRAALKALRLGRSERPPQGADFLRYTLAYKGHRATRYTLPKTWRPVVARLDAIMTKYWAPD